MTRDRDEHCEVIVNLVMCQTSDLGGCQLCEKKNECGLRWCGWRDSCVAVHAGPRRTRQSALSPPAAMLPQDSRQVVVATDY